MKILVGSVAAEMQGAKLNRKEIKDIDYFADEPKDSIEPLRGFEKARIETFYHPLLEEWEWSGDVASLDELYTIKVSHSYWMLKNNSWRKHVRDAAMMKRVGAKLIPELHAILYKVWEDRYGKKKANLEQEPDEFFNSRVPRVYEHDSIHASVAYYDGVPLFNKILRDNHAVAVDRSKFEALSHQMKLELVREEVYATALERRVIPSDYTINPRIAYDHAFEKTITSFTKGWFPTFIMDNFEALRTPAEDYIAIHKENSHLLVALENA